MREGNKKSQPFLTEKQQSIQHETKGKTKVMENKSQKENENKRVVNIYNKFYTRKPKTKCP